MALIVMIGPVAGAGAVSLKAVLTARPATLDLALLKVPVEIDREAWDTVFVKGSDRAFRVQTRERRVLVERQEHALSQFVPISEDGLDEALVEEEAYETEIDACVRTVSVSDRPFSVRSHFYIVLKMPTGQRVKIEADARDSIEAIKLRVAERGGPHRHEYRLLYNGKHLVDRRSLLDYNIQQGSTLQVVQSLRGGKPVIYLFPPAGTSLPQVDVALSLSPQWHFSALYPLAPVASNKDGSSTAAWTVSASSTGALVELSTGLDLSYIFWESEALRVSLPPSPPLLAVDPPPRAFNPACPILTPCNAVLLPFDAFIPYLHKTLVGLTLHTSAHNDFITYWLPAFVRLRDQKKQIAVRFLPQKEYEQAAMLNISPTPDVVTRVFMLFGGVGEMESGWEGAQTVEIDWNQVVGVHGAARDASKFRVLEWGGMEVV